MHSDTSRVSVQNKWNHMYELARQYYQDHGNLLISSDMITPCGKRLGRWIGTQRMEAKKNTQAFTVERRSLLEKIGMVWDVKENAWQKMYLAACVFYHREGHLRVPAQHVTAEGVVLGGWISAGRQLYQNHSMPAHRVALLTQIGMVWSIKNETLSRWDDYYEQCLAYLQKNGGALVPKKQRAADGTSLGEWFVRQKCAYRANELSPEHKRKMERFAPAITALEAQWLAWYASAEQFFQKNKHLSIPPGTRCACGDLHAWINTQRVQYTRGRLDEEKINLLEKLCIVWRVRDTGWETLFRRAEQYYHTHGDLMVPRDYEADGGLSAWISNQRKDRRQGRSTLTTQRISRLDAIGMCWEPFEEVWEKQYTQAKQYFEQTGHLVVKKDLDSALWQWIQQQRTAKKSGYLTAKRVERLDAIGMVWGVFEQSWERMYAAAKAYYKIHEQLNIPASYVTTDGLHLGRWISGQRRKYQLFLTVGDPTIQRRFERLNQIGMIWDASKRIYFTSFQEQAIMYYVGKIEPSTVKMNLWEEIGIEIDVYLPGLRVGIEYDGYFHKDKEKSDIQKNQICEEYGIRLLRIREPGLPLLSLDSAIYFLSDLSPQTLDEAIRWVFRMLNFPDARIDTERDRPAILEAYRDVNAPAWDRMYESAHSFFVEHGSLDTRDSSGAEINAMRRWLTKQRRCYYDGLLTTRQENKLMKLHFLDGAIPFEKTPRDAMDAKQKISDTLLLSEKRILESQKKERVARANWERAYALAGAYYERNGNLLVPRKYIAPDGAALGTWISTQRRRYLAGSLSPLEIQKLETIMMVWEPKKQSLRQWMYAAEEYHKTHGHINAPLEYVNKRGQHLGSWLSNMRTKYKKGDLDNSLIGALERLGIQWCPLEERWERMCALAEEFFARQGHLNVPADLHVAGEGSLRVWLQLQRQKYMQKDYASGSLTEEQIARLNAIGMLWEPYREKWMCNYALARAYYRQYGDLNIKATYCTPDGKKLGMWLATQRQAYRGNPNYHMTQERIRLLNEIGMDWRTDTPPCTDEGLVPNTQ